MVGRGVSIARLAALFTNPFTGVDRPVVDRTGLTGTFDFDVEWCLSIDSSPAPGAPVEICEPTFRQAIEDQLGLSIKRSTGPIDVRVIDHIERPSAN